MKDDELAMFVLNAQVVAVKGSLKGVAQVVRQMEGPMTGEEVARLLDHISDNVTVESFLETMGEPDSPFWSGPS